MSVLRAALAELELGHAVIPIPEKEKGPKISRWQNMRLTRDRANDVFGCGPMNIGILNGDPSNGLVDVDLDCPEAVALASTFLPPTGRIWGRSSKPKSHYAYYCAALTRTRQFKDADGSTIVELRSSGSQTLIPPSVHPSGETVEWAVNTGASSVGSDELIGRVEQLAASALLAKYWPAEGGRHAFALAVAGMLAAGGMDEQSTTEIVLAAARAAGDTVEDGDRTRAVASTYRNFEAGRTITGEREVGELSGQPKIVELIKRWLHLHALPSVTKVSASKRLIETVLTRCELFHDGARDAWATIKEGQHRETHRIDSRVFKTYLAGLYYRETKRSAASATISDTVATLTGKAVFEREEREVFIRVGHDSDTIWIDLGTGTFEAVRVTAEGWSVEPWAAVPFHRPAGFAALPIPVRDGDLGALRSFLNVSSERDFHLVVAYIVAALRPKGPYPVLILGGEQGSAKSTTARVIRSLVDPNQAALRTPPKDARDLAVAAENSWVLAYDNLSGIPNYLSDCLCRLSTGGGFSVRQLYTDRDESVFDAQRPIIITGIHELATRGDLIDRSLAFTLPAIDPKHRRTDAELNHSFVRAAPKLFGAILDALSLSLRLEDQDAGIPLPRMADFARVGIALERGLGWAPGSFLASYAQVQEDANLYAIEGDPVAQVVLSLMEREERWEGTAMNLLVRLGFEANRLGIEQNSRYWPKNASHLSNRLIRIQPLLRQQGVFVKRDRQGKSRERIITLERGSTQ